VLSLAVLIAALLALPVEAGSAELPVSYLVEMGEFHRNMLSDSTLSFELHADADCTARVHAEDLTAGGLELLPKKLELQPGATQPLGSSLALRLFTTLDPPSSEGPFFLHVSGEGIVPLGLGCQAQVAGASAGVRSFLDQEFGVVFSLEASSGQLFSVFGDLLFAVPHCQGRAYTTAAMAGLVLTNELWGESRRIFLVRSAPVAAQVETRSRIQPSGSGRCENSQGFFRDLVEAEELVPEALGFAIPVPLRLELGSRDP
jgi:hypothetical protein